MGGGEMARVPDGVKRVEVYLPADLAAQVESLIGAGGVVPHGGWNSFFVGLVRERFGCARLELGQYRGFAADAVVSGSEAAIRQISRMLSALVPKS